MADTTDVNAELIERLVGVMAAQLEQALNRIMAAPTIPVAIDLWDIATIARYLKRSPSHVRDHLACRPDFPRPIRLPTEGSRGGQALYRASEVIAWAEGLRHGPGRPRKCA